MSLARVAFISLLLFGSAHSAESSSADIRAIVSSVSTPRDQQVAFGELRMSPLFETPLTFSGYVEFAADGTLSKFITDPVSEGVSISEQKITMQRGKKKRSLSLRRNFLL